MPTLLLSVHTFDDVPVRLYNSQAEAMADRAHWVAERPSEHVGFRLVGFDGGHPQEVKFFEV